MNRDELCKMLHHLLEELEEVEGAAPVDAGILEELRREIGHVIEEEEACPKKLAERLEEKVHHFTDTHPGVSRAIGEATDVLGRMGL